jgi:hypothetical protein
MRITATPIARPFRICGPYTNWNESIKASISSPSNAVAV